MSRGEVAVVVWGGGFGGAEAFSISLAAALRRRGTEARIQFVLDPGPFQARVDELQVPHHSLGFSTGRVVLHRPRAFARAVTATGPRAAILVTTFYMGAALRAGGYRGAVIGIEHGELILLPARRGAARALRLLSRAAGARAADGEVAVSDFMLGILHKHRRAQHTTRIYNGIDLHPANGQGRGGDRDDANGMVIGHASRLIPGKGTDDLIQAFAAVRDPACRLHIAGDGPERRRLEALANTLSVSDRVVFQGVVSDMEAFWKACDVAAVPSNEFVESFGMVAVEAMSVGKPVVFTRNGALPEVIPDGEAGLLAEPGDVPGIAAALDRYAHDPALRERHGEAGRTRCERTFDIDRVAGEYEEFLQAVERDRSAR
jgi:glycosyltransferase involved in cell wall biosynthesis